RKGAGSSPSEGGGGRSSPRRSAASRPLYRGFLSFCGSHTLIRFRDGVADGFRDELLRRAVLSCELGDPFRESCPARELLWASVGDGVKVQGAFRQQG